jgi:hypothetical protein
MQEDYALEVNPIDTNYLQKTFIEKTSSKGAGERISYWDHIQSYRSGAYHEKTFLIDPKVAAVIAETIEKHSERGAATKFVDADAGLCQVTKEVIQRNIFTDGSHVIFEKDPNFLALNKRAQQNYLTKECKLRKISLVKSVAENRSSWKGKDLTINDFIVGILSAVQTGLTNPKKLKTKFCHKQLQKRPYSHMVKKARFSKKIYQNISNRF